MTKSKFSTPGKPRLRGVDDLDAFQKLLAGRDQRGAVLLRPGVILDMRDLDALRADLGRKVDDLAAGGRCFADASAR